ncbi:hypothetical protein BLOT_007890 [Blomia tropicalis]|nr:hypothetical protein BLOT_007890 [Blomia tropicalis]
MNGDKCTLNELYTSAVINNNNNTTLIKTANGQTVVFTGSGASTVSSISSVNSAIENNIDSNGLNNPNTNGDDNNNDLNSIHHQNTNKSILLNDSILNLLVVVIVYEMFNRFIVTII